MLTNHAPPTSCRHFSASGDALGSLGSGRRAARRRMRTPPLTLALAFAFHATAQHDDAFANQIKTPRALGRLQRASQAGDGDVERP